MGDDPAETARLHLETGRLINEVPVAGKRTKNETTTIDDIPVAGRVNQEMSLIGELVEELGVDREDLAPLEGTGVLELIHGAIVGESERAVEEGTTDLTDLPGSGSTRPRTNWDWRRYLEADGGEEIDADVPVAGRRVGE